MADDGEGVFDSRHRMERLHPAEISGRRRIEREAVCEGFGGLYVQRLLPESLCSLDTVPHLCTGITRRSSRGGRVLELDVFLMRREHILPQLSVLVALSAENSLGYGGETSGRGAPFSLPSQRLAEDEWVRDGPNFVRAVFRGRAGLRKVHISKKALR